VTWLEAELLLTAGFSKMRDRKVWCGASPSPSRRALHSRHRFHAVYSDTDRMPLQLSVWDARSTAAPLHVETLEASSAMLVPLYDADSKVRPYAAGRPLRDGSVC
jgi:hypothetical protein